MDKDKVYELTEGFYVEKITARVGDCLSFWKSGDYGYDTSLDGARIWTMGELENEAILGNKKYAIWPKDHLDKIAHRHVHCHFVDKEELISYEI